MRVLMWIRTDLGLRDNTALHAAARATDHGLVAVFVTCPQQGKKDDWGPPKVDFVIRNAAAL